jgi:hypothetical protein
MNTPPQRRPWWCLVVAALAAVPAAVPGQEPGNAVAPTTFADYLATWKIDKAGRRSLAEPGAWNAPRQEAAVRVVARLARIPGGLFADWSAGAAAPTALPADDPVQDRLVRIEGRATFVRGIALEPAEAEIAGRKQVDVVRIVAADDTAYDVLADRVPEAWPRGREFAEPAAAVGLPLAGAGLDPLTGSGPAKLLLAAPGVSWYPATPLGGLGVDYGLFGSVVDGRKLEPGDTEAFYAVLAAVGRPQAVEAAAAGPPVDLVPLIDPGQDWFRKHRGEPVTIEGVARRATRITIDDPRRRAQVGADHYWELYVFVPTSLIKVNDRLQEDFPVVCCVRSLPAGMPAAQRMGERVRVSGFAFKRYGYPLPDVKISSSQGDREQKGQRQETALVIGREPVWMPAASPRRQVDSLGWVFLAIAGLLATALAAAAWAFSRDSARRRRADLPDRIDLP